MSIVEILINHASVDKVLVADVSFGFSIVGVESDRDTRSG